jgi:hypothetical protein
MFQIVNSTVTHASHVHKHSILSAKEFGHLIPRHIRPKSLAENIECSFTFGAFETVELEIGNTF